MKHIIDTDELEPCPFCGSHNISAGEVSGNHLDGTYFVQTACMNCGALSPEAKTENESAELWNRRKFSPPQADSMVLVPSEPTELQLNSAYEVETMIIPPSSITDRERVKAIYKAMLSAYKPQAECKTSPVSSRMCELGTKACVVEHKPQADDVRKDAEREWTENDGNHESSKKLANRMGRIDVKFRSGFVAKDYSPNDFDFSQSGSDHDITAFRPHKFEKAIDKAGE